MIALLAYATAPAHALFVQATYCVEYNIDYTDAATGDLLTGSTTKARGVMLRFFPDGLAPYDDYYVDWDGADPGCRTITLDDSTPYTVKVVHQAFVNDNYLRSMTTDNGAIYATTVATGHVPVNNRQYDYDIGPTNSVRNLAAATWAMQRRSVGIEWETIDLFNATCPNTSTSCAGSAGVWIKPDHSYYKFIIGHELGHKLSYLANGGNTPAKSGSANPGDCSPAYANSGHKMNSKEYQSIASSEAIAHFYSAIAFNHDQPFDDCEIEKHYQPDWNLDGVYTVDDVTIFSCESGISSLGIDNFDYLGDYCVANGAWQNRGTEYDWLRHFWDLRTDMEVSGADIFEIWDRANPHTWIASGIGQGSNYPSDRLEDAADDVGVLGEWNSSASSNGVQR